MSARPVPTRPPTNSRTPAAATPIAVTAPLRDAHGKRRLLKPEQREDVVTLEGLDKEQSLEIRKINDRLQDFVELILTHYVNSWYSRITPRDRKFVPHLNHLLITTFQSIATSLTAPGGAKRLVELLLIRVPIILEYHLKVVRLAQKAQGTSVDGGEGLVMGGLAGDPGSGSGQDTRKSGNPLARTYHSLAPHQALVLSPYPPLPPTLQTTSPINSTFPPPAPPPPTSSTTFRYQISPLYTSRLSTHLLRLHLPKKDSSSELEMALVSEILGQAVLGNVFRKLSEGFMIWKILLAVLGEPGTPSRRLKQNQKIQEDGYTKTKTPMPTEKIPQSKWEILIALAISILSTLGTLFTSIGKTFSSSIELYHTYKNSPPAELHLVNILSPSLSLLQKFLTPPLPHQTQTQTSRSKDGLLKLISGISVLTNPLTDKLIPPKIETILSDPKLITKVLDKLQDIVFPGGGMMVNVPDPTVEETLAMRRRLEERIYERIPAAARYLVIGSTEESQREIIHEMLEPFSNAELNAHLLAMLLDAVMVTILPD